MPIADIFRSARSRSQYSGAATIDGELAIQRPAIGLALLPSRWPRIRHGRRRVLRSGSGRIGLGSYGEFLSAGAGQPISIGPQAKPNRERIFITSQLIR